jgi:hypothetical protein
VPQWDVLSELELLAGAALEDGRVVVAVEHCEAHSSGGFMDSVGHADVELEAVGALVLVLVVQRLNDGLATVDPLRDPMGLEAFLL